MVTGGFRTSNFINKVIKDGRVDIIGLARPLCLNPNMPAKILKGEIVESNVRQLSSGIKALDKVFPLEIIWYTMQIHRLGKGLEPAPNSGVFTTILKSIWEIGWQVLKKVRMS